MKTLFVLLIAVGASVFSIQHSPGNPICGRTGFSFLMFLPRIQSMRRYFGC